MNKPIRKTLSIVLSIIMIVTMIPFTPVAFATTGYDCTREGCDGFYNDDGFCAVCRGYEKPPVSGEVYYASNAGHLYWFAEAYNTSVIRGKVTLYIENDINIGQTLPFDNSTGFFSGDASKLRKWIPIGNSASSAFSGTILGNGHSITSLYCEDDELTAVGFIGYGAKSTIKDLKISNSVFIGNTWYETNYGTTNSAPVGSFFGVSSSDKLTNCVSYATVDTANDGAGGGLIGHAIASVIDHSAFLGRVYGQSVMSNAILGGLIGYAQSETKYGAVLTHLVVKNSVNNGILIPSGNGCYVGQISGAVIGGTYENSYYLNENGSDSLKAIGYVDVVGGYGRVYPASEDFHTFTNTDANDGTLCEDIGGHLMSNGRCVFCTYSCNEHTWEGKNCSNCGVGMTFTRDIEIEVPTTAYIGDEFVLTTAKVLPLNATFRDITWSVVSGPASIVNGTVKFNNTGSVTLKATVVNGLGISSDYSETFTVTVNSKSEIDISKIDGSYYPDRLTIYESEGQLCITYNSNVTTFVPIGTQIVLTGSNTGSNYAGVDVTDCENPVNIKLKNATFSGSAEGLAIKSGVELNLVIEGTNNITATDSTNYDAIELSEDATLNISGTGTLNAKGRVGIGCGGYNSSLGKIVINGGTVNAESTNNGAAIGLGYRCNGGTIIINGGTVNARGGSRAAGIGGGYYSDNINITINGGTVNAYGSYGKSGSNTGGAGIGTGMNGSEGSITITGGTVYAKGGVNSAGIGGGDSGTVNSITITGGTITAEGNYLGAGIGGGLQNAVDNIVISGGNIKATSGKANAVGSGGNTRVVTPVTDGKGNNVSCATITLDGAAANTAISKATGVSYGLKDVKTLDNNKLYFYLPADTEATSITAGGNEYICNNNLTYYTAHSWANNDGICANGCGYECPHDNQTGQTCEICGVTLHICDFSGEWKYDADKHWKECTVDGCDAISEEAEHSFTDGKCDCGYACPHGNYTDGVCDNCNYECPHEWGEGVLTRPVYDAVLGSKDGYYTYTCTVCGKEKKEAVKGADYSAYDAVSEEINGLLQSDDLTPEAKQAIYSAANECGLLSNDLTESEQNIVDSLVAELEKIIADADEKIASGEYVKADYTSIDNDIYELEYKLENKMITDEGKSGFEDIKKQLNEMKADENTSKADLAELKKALREYEAEIDKGIEDGTLVKFDGEKVFSDYEREVGEALIEKYGADFFLNFINKVLGEKFYTEYDKIYSDACALTGGTMAENAENIAQIKASVDELYGKVVNCIEGVHNGFVYEVTEEAKCGVNAIESATCTLCGETDEREIEGTALKHSFTKYEETEAPKCGVAGKEVAYCDHGCGKTDEKEIAALEHEFDNYVSNGDATCEKDGTKTAECIYGCGATDTVIDEDTMLEHADEDGDKVCDDCGGEIKELCKYCGRNEHAQEGIPQYICLIIMFVRLVVSLVKALS